MRGLLPGPRSSTSNSTICQKSMEHCWTESNYLEQAVVVRLKLEGNEGPKGRG